MPKRAQPEFSTATKREAWDRCRGFCEGKIPMTGEGQVSGKLMRCSAPLKGRKKEYDHILPIGLGGKSTLANLQVLCEACHTRKTSKEDVPRMAKADRQKNQDVGAEKPHKQAIPHRPGPEKKPPRELAPGVSNIARRYGIKQEKKDGA